MEHATEPLFRRILMPTDFSPASEEMLHRAVAVSVQHGAALRVFHAELFETECSRAAEHRETMLALLDRCRASWAGHPRQSEATFEYASVDGTSAAAAIDAEIAAVRPDLVVMATHGGDLLFESVAEHVVDTAPCAVLSSRRGASMAWPRDDGRVLVPVDFSAEARRALATARSLAGQCTVRLIHVVDDDTAADTDADARLDELRAWAFEGEESVLVHGRPGPALVDISQDPDVALVVLGTHAVHTRTERMLGTMAVTLTGKSHAPVLTVR